MSNFEAELYRTLKNVNDVTKANVTTNLMNAVTAGQITVDQNTLKQIVTVVSSTIDQGLDLTHTQVAKVNEAQAKTRKKPAGRTTKK